MGFDFSSRTGRRCIAGLFACVILFGGVVGWLDLEHKDRLVRAKDKGSVAASGDPEAIKRVAEPNPKSFHIVQSVLPRQAVNFSLFRTTPEPLPAAVRHIMREPEFGANWDLSQRVPSTAAKAWLLPADGFVCILARVNRLSMACAPTRIALARGIAIVALASHRRRLSAGGGRFMIGVAPDRAGKIAVRTGGTVTNLPVDGYGVFVLRDESASPPDLLTVR